MRACCLCLIAVLLSLGRAVGAGIEVPQVSLPEPSYHFNVLGISEPVEHVFHFRNDTQATLEIAGIKVTPPLAVSNISARVFPGQVGMLRFRLGDPRPVGDYEGFIEVDFKNPGVSNIIFEVTGRITPVIEAKPFPAFFVATGRGQSKEASIQLINHGEEALEITRIECSSQRFSLRLWAGFEPANVQAFWARSARPFAPRPADKDRRLQETDRDSEVRVRRLELGVHGKPVAKSPQLKVCRRGTKGAIK